MARPVARRAGRRALVGGCAVAAAAVAGVSISAATSSASAAYRTATVSRSTVTKTLHVTGTLQPVNEASASFQVAGTVSSVSVTVGEHVNAAQVLASLVPTTLQEAVTAAQTSLGADEAKLSADEAGQTTTVSSSAASAATTSAVGGSGTVLTAASTSNNTAALQAAQQAVVTAQEKADSDRRTAAADLADAESTCSAASSSGPGGGTSGGGSSTSTTTTTAPSTTSTTSTSTTSTSTTAPASTTTSGSGSSQSQACTDALNTAMQAQSQVAADQSAVSNAEGNLAKLLSADASSVSSPPSASTGTGNSRSGTGSTTSGSGSSGGTGGAGASGSGASSPGTGLSGPGSTQTGTDGAAQLATDQATIDSAQAALVSDQQSLADAQLTSPIAGTVVSIGISPAQSISAGSTTDTITVINSGGYQVSSSLTPAQVSGAAVGDSVQVTVYGTTGPITGTVSRVGPVSTGSSSDTYPVIVALDPAASSLSAGSTAAVAIDSAQASNALVVPSSAVHTATPGRSYVLVLQAGKEKQARVTVGVVGDTYTQVTSGLTDGETVVLADPSMALPTSNATITGPGFGGGGFPGGTGGR